MEALMTAIKFRDLLFLVAALMATFAAGYARADGTCDFSHESPDEKLYQLHSDGSIFVKNDLSCKDKACFGGWFLLDNNRQTVAIASYCELYQMHNDGSIFHYTGRGTAQDQCTGGFCGNWEQLDQNAQTKTIVVGAPYFDLNSPPVLYQMHNDGAIFRKNNKPCAEPACFGGWDLLDHNPSTTVIIAGLNGLYQMHSDGNIFRWDGKTLCDGKGCPGWALLDQNPDTGMITAGSGFYQLHKSGTIFRYLGDNSSCAAAPCPGWELVGQDAATTTIKAGFSGFYRLQRDGEVLRKGANNSWQVLDQHSDTLAITAGRLLYEMRAGGRIFRYNETPCGPTPGCDAAWDQLDENPNSGGIVVNGTLSLR
jgi:hypothetical protein